MKGQRAYRTERGQIFGFGRIVVERRTRFFPQCDISRDGAGGARRTRAGTIGVVVGALYMKRASINRLALVANAVVFRLWRGPSQVRTVSPDIYDYDAIVKRLTLS